MDSPLLRTFQDFPDVKVLEIERNEVFSPENVNLALKKVAGGGSRGKTVLKKKC